MKFNELFKLLKTSLSKIDKNLEPEIVSSYFMRIYYTEKPVLDIKYIKNKQAITNNTIKIVLISNIPIKAIPSHPS